MGNEAVAASIPTDDQGAAVVVPSRSRQAQRTKAMLIVFALVVATILGATWWSSLLSAEEQAYLGRWLAIESVKRNVPKEETLSTLIRELEFKQDHEVRLKFWTQPIDKVRSTFPLGALFPIRMTGPLIDSGEIAVVATPHPATLPESIKNHAPGAEITGRWKIENGQIDIEWDSNDSLFQSIRDKMSPYLYGVQIVRFSRDAHGTVTRNREDQITIQWIRPSSKFTGNMEPLQVWSRQSEKR